MDKTTKYILLSATAIILLAVVLYIFSSKGKVSQTSSEIDGPPPNTNPPNTNPPDPSPPSNSVETANITSTAILLNDVLSGWYVVSNEMRDKAVDDALSFPVSKYSELIFTYNSVSGGKLLKDDVSEAISRGAGSKWNQFLTGLNLA